jgi:hypothetical protein
MGLPRLIEDATDFGLTIEEILDPRSRRLRRLLISSGHGYTVGMPSQVGCPSVACIHRGWQRTSPIP